MIIDESAVFEPAGDLTYVVASAVVVPGSLDVVRVQAAAAIGFGAGRRRPFHWVDEGPMARRAMREVTQAYASHVVTAVASGVGRRGQEHVRQAGLRSLIEHVVSTVALAGILIESREHSTSAVGQNKHDCATIIEARHAKLLDPEMTFEWAPKSDPAVWLADAVAGAVAFARIGRQPLELDEDRLTILEVRS